MIFKTTPIKGLYEIFLQEHSDIRGGFARVFCKKEFQQMGLINEFVQINHSWNKAAGTLRGLHFQKPPMGEVKLIRCIRGAVFDVAVDLRKGSETFLKWHALILTEKDRNMVYIPRGMAHGFITLENESELIYHHSQYFDPLSEMAFHYQDPGINIKWPLKPRVISEKDQNNPFINEDFEGFIF